MTGSAPVPQVVVRGEVMLLVEPEVADVGMTETSAFGAELTGLLEASDAEPSGGGLRVAEAMASMARFEASELDLSPAREEAHGVVEVRSAMSEPDLEVFRG
jgi:hypothetical protein